MAAESPRSSEGTALSRRLVKSAVRVLEVLALFAREQRALPQKYIVSVMKYPQSSSTFLLRSLVETGYLSYDRVQRSYFPTPEVLHLGIWLEKFGYEQFFRQSALTRLLEALQERSDETICVATQTDIFAQFHRVLLRNLSVGLYIEEGTTLPLSYSPYGYVLMATLPNQQVDRICRLLNARETDRSLCVDPSEVLEIVAKVRRDGYFYMRNPYLRGGGAVAVLLPVRIGGRQAVVGIGGVAERIEGRLEHFVRLLIETVQAHDGELQGAYPTVSGRT